MQGHQNYRRPKLKHESKKYDAISDKPKLSSTTPLCTNIGIKGARGDELYQRGKGEEESNQWGGGGGEGRGGRSQISGEGGSSTEKINYSNFEFDWLLLDTENNSFGSVYFVYSHSLFCSLVAPPIAVLPNALSPL